MTDMRLLFSVPGLLLTLLLSVAASEVAAKALLHPDWAAHHWTVRDGLPVNSINAMVRDAHGFLWLATMDGLVRFDGKRFEIFDTLNSPGLAGNRLLVLARDGDNALWMATEHTRLVRYHNGLFRTLRQHDGLPHDSVIALSVTERSVWAGTRQGAARWNGTEFEGLHESLWNESTTAILEPGDGSVWLGGESGRLLKLGPDGASQTATVAARVWQMAADAEGGVWIAHGAGLARWNGRDLNTELLVDDGLQRLERLGQSLLMAGSGRLFRLDSGQWTEQPALFPGSGRERLAGQAPSGTWLNAETGLLRDDELILAPRFAITDWLVDETGGLLVATAGDGLYRLTPNAFKRPSGPSTLLDAPVYPIVESPEGSIWIGTNGQGLYRIAPGQIEAQRFAESGPAIVYTLLADDGESGWIGGEGLWRLESGIAHQHAVPEQLHEAVVRALFRDGQGRIWAGTEATGLWRFDGDAWRPVLQANGSAVARVRVIVEHGDHIWFGTNGYGLLRFGEGEGFESLIDGRQGRLIRALHFDQAGRLLIGTEDRGLCRLEMPGASLDSAQVHCLDRRDGLPYDGIHQILPDRHGRLWMSTNRGIFSVSGHGLETAIAGSALSARLLTEADGLPDREANGGVQSAGMVDGHGRLWFPTMRGPVALDTSRLPEAAPAPTAVIEHVATAAGFVTLGEGSVDLPVGMRNLTIGFTAPHFSDRGSLRFETRLIGLDATWQTIAERREVDFTNLPRGPFRFEVRARGVDGQAGQVAALDFVIPAYFHETPAFRSGAVMVLLAMAWLAWRRRERQLAMDRARLESEVSLRTRELSEAKLEAERGRDQIVRQARRLERLDEEKRSFFANISHELRTPLTLLLGPLEQGQRDPTGLIKQLPLMHRNARRLNRLVGQILDLQRIEANHLHMHPELHDLADWAQTVSNLFVPLAESRRISIRFIQPDEGVLAWFDSAQMEKVLGNLLSNAIKYCHTGDQVEVVVARDQETALIEVSDTGPGIAAEHLPRLFDRFYRATPGGAPIEGSGIGLALARELALLHGGDLSVTSTPGEGTRFNMNWPARATAACLTSQTPVLPSDAVPSDIGVESSQGTARASDDAPRILIVDDNNDLRLWLRHVLDERYIIDEAGNGQAALDRMNSCLPDLVVSDWMMPGMDGIKLVERMRECPELQTLPVIMLSARAESADRVTGLEAGAVVYVPKPFHAETLVAQIESLLALSLRLRLALAEAPESVIQKPGESAWLRQLREVVAANLHDPTFGVDALAECSSIGRSGLFRRLKDEAGQSPSALLREARLQRAADLLDQRAGTVSEIAYAVGFGTIDGFTRAFTAHFDQRPSERLARKQQSSARAN
jgi:signal transduction histidine kinase/ligand-binding sensor domain-containing protein/DNA-binding NarL/FixJ family response regulator